ncbi:MAG: DUF6326 family protein [Acidiferrobacterales bacterium]
MTGNTKSGTALEDIKISTKLKISALWASVMLLYLYGDYFSLYKTGTLDHMLAGEIGPLGQVTQGILLGTSVLMAIPALMVFLAIVLKPAVNRWSNIILGVIYTVIVLIGLPGEWYYYIFLGVLEAILTLLIVWYAWTWPKNNNH